MLGIPSRGIFLRTHLAVRHTRLALAASAAVTGIFVGSLLAFTGAPWARAVGWSWNFVAQAAGMAAGMIGTADYIVLASIVAGWVGAYFVIRHALKGLLRWLEAMPE